MWFANGSRNFSDMKAQKKWPESKESSAVTDKSGTTLSNGLSQFISPSPLWLSQQSVFDFGWFVLFPQKIHYKIWLSPEIGLCMFSLFCGLELPLAFLVPPGRMLCFSESLQVWLHCSLSQWRFWQATDQLNAAVVLVEVELVWNATSTSSISLELVSDPLHCKLQV